MASINRVTLIGNLGRDPEMRYLPSGEAVATFSVATTEQWKDKAGGKQERTDWHRIEFYRVTSEGTCPRCKTPVAGRFGEFKGQFGRQRIPVRLGAGR